MYIEWAKDLLLAHSVDTRTVEDKCFVAEFARFICGTIERLNFREQWWQRSVRLFIVPSGVVFVAVDGTSACCQLRCHCLLVWSGRPRSIVDRSQRSCPWPLGGMGRPSRMHPSICWNIHYFSC